MDINNIVDVVYVVCLPSRKEYINNLMSKLGIKYQIINAILKKDINKDELVKVGLLKNKKLKDGSIACYLSHMKAMSTFLQTNYNNCLVFEDDIRMPTENEINRYKSIKHDLINIIENENKWDIIYLGKCWCSCSTNKKIVGDFYYAKTLMCLHSYIMNKRSAKKYLNFEPLNVQHDRLVSETFDKKVVLHPSLFYQNTEESTLGRGFKVGDFLGLGELNNSGLECTNDLIKYKPIQKLIMITLGIIIVIIIIVLIIIYKKK